MSCAVWFLIIYAIELWSATEATKHTCRAENGTANEYRWKKQLLIGIASEVESMKVQRRERERERESEKKGER